MTDETSYDAFTRKLVRLTLFANITNLSSLFYYKQLSFLMCSHHKEDQLI